MSIISTGNIPALLKPGIEDVAGLAYMAVPQKWRKLFETRTTKRNYDEDVYVVDTGLAAEKGMGSAISFDDVGQHFISQYRQKTYGLAVRVNFEAIDDNLYKDKVDYSTFMLAKSYAETQNVIGHNILNNAFSSIYTYGDGKELIATDHPLLGGGTYSNELTTAANLSQKAIEDLLIQIGNLETDKGRKLVLSPVSLHVPVALQFKARRILESILQSDTAENAKNVLSGIFSGGLHVHEHFTSTTAWFIKTDCPMGLKYLERMAPRIDTDNDFNTKDIMFSIVGRYVFGVTDTRAIFGTPGV